MNTPETINIEKYANALNNLIGVDSAYMAGDKSVDAIVEVIVAAKKLENKVKELTEENKKLNKSMEKELLDSARIFDNYCRMINALRKEADQIKVETVRKMQNKIISQSEYGTINISTWQLDQIAKEVLEENDD
jgi:hypothetical protein